MASQHDIYSITSASQGLSEEQRGRTRRYLFSMGIRTACFIGAIIATGWLRWTLLLGAIALPYLAVVIANAGRESGRKAPAAYFVQDRPALTAREERD